MSVIYKYALTHGENELALPSDSLPLSVNTQDNTVMLWVLHHRDPNRGRVYVRKFHVVNTGEEFDIGYSKFIGTVLLRGGNYVKHVFEQLNIS